MHPQAHEERHMDPITLATTITTFLAPYLAKTGKSLMEEASSQIPGAIGKLCQTIFTRFKENPAAAGTADDLVKNSDDEDIQKAFILQLKMALKNDLEFAGSLAKLLEDAKAEAGISNVGSGVVATNNSVVVANVNTGDVGGDFIIGQNINKGK